VKDIQVACKARNQHAKLANAGGSGDIPPEYFENYML